MNGARVAVKSLSRHRGELVDRYAGMSPTERVTGTSWARDSDGDTGFQNVAMFHAGLMIADDMGGLQAAFARAMVELQDLGTKTGESALDLLISYIPAFQHQEIEIRKRLEKQYRSTPMWPTIQARWDRIDVGTTAALRAVVRLYTTDVVYRHLNACFRSGEAHEYTGYGILLMYTQEVVPYFTGAEAYRGMQVSDLETYEPGLVFRWPFFVSASANKEAAQEFAPVTWIVRMPQSAPNVAMDIREYSVYPSEAEVLFYPYTAFEVVERTDREVVVQQLARPWVA